MTKDRWLAVIGAPKGSRDVLFAIAHAGAGVAATKQTCRELGDAMATLGVRLPGRESRLAETPLTDLDEVADQLAASIERAAENRRVYLYGHCSGGIVGYEVARRLPSGLLAQLVVSAQEAPDRIKAQGAWQLPREQFLTQVAADGYLPTALLDQPEMLDMLEPALRADYEAVETRSPCTDALDVPILGLLGIDEHAVTEADMRAWESYTSAGFELRRLPGGHNLLHDHPGAVAAAIRSTLPPA